MDDTDHQDSAPQAAATAWLEAFEDALSGHDVSSAAELFLPDGHWRDVLAFTWRLETVSGRPSIEETLRRTLASTKPAGFRLHPGRTRPRRVVRAGTEVIEVIFAFETAFGSGNGVVRLVPDPGAAARARAWTLLTALDELRGRKDGSGTPRPGAEEFSREFGGENWMDKRDKARAYADHDPAVIVVGGGQAGLSIAARLGRLSIERSWSVAPTTRRRGDGASRCAARTERNVPCSRATSSSRQASAASRKGRSCPAWTTSAER